MDPNAEKVNAVKGVQVYLQTHAWQDPNGYPGGGIHERGAMLGEQERSLLTVAPRRSP